MTFIEAETLVARWLAGEQLPQAQLEKALDRMKAEEDALIEHLQDGDWAFVWAGLTIGAVGLAALVGWAGRHWSWW